MTEEYTPILPFVCVESVGGPFNDAAFVAGFECGAIDMALNVTTPIGAVIRRWVKSELIEQIDLIAMHHGRQVRLGDLSDDLHWRYIEIDIPKEEDIV